MLEAMILLFHKRRFHKLASSLSNCWSSIFIFLKHLHINNVNLYSGVYAYVILYIHSFICYISEPRFLASLCFLWWAQFMPKPLIRTPPHASLITQLSTTIAIVHPVLGCATGYITQLWELFKKHYLIIICGYKII